MTDLSANASMEHHQEHAADSGGHVHFDPLANRLGFWLFLFTEVFLFGMLFLAFAIYLNYFRADFSYCSSQLDVLLGGINTVVLLTSSLTMALAIQAVQREKKGLSLLYMAITIGFAVAFCVIKSFEWGHKFDLGIYPNSEFLATLPRGQQLFYGLYYVMTGFHAFHVICGSLLIGVAMMKVAAGKVHKDRLSFIENAGLFWHLVDLVWIYLFPLYYLIH